MTRLGDLIERAKLADPNLGKELETEVKRLERQRNFGLVFERHAPESTQLFGRKPRVGDKVNQISPRGSLAKPDNRLWRVLDISNGQARLLEILPGNAEWDDARIGRKQEVVAVPCDDIVVLAEHSDTIYPGLVETGRVDNADDSIPAHTVINGENLHVLEALTYTHGGRIDCIYIDPPYNTGAKDWKYNNDYVDTDDSYRHSKWLSFMERRLLVAKKLLNSKDSVLIVTIDEKEYLRLGMLLEQTFPEATIQMVSSVINPSGSSRAGRFGRADEYLFFVYFGESVVHPWKTDMLRNQKTAKKRPVRWNGLIRNGAGSNRSRIPSLFYPIHFNIADSTFHSVGEPLAPNTKVDSYIPPAGTVAKFPIDSTGQELMWRLYPPTLRTYLEKGYARFSKKIDSDGTRSPQYLQKGMIAKVEDRSIRVLGRDKEGALILEYAEGAGTYAPLTVWNMVSHSAAEHGSAVVKSFLPGRKFPFPKSLYAVEDTIRFFVKDKPNATVLDFFSGSGTTAHAVMRLNKQDGGRRQSISVTNNEVSAEEQVRLREQAFRPGDPEWEQWGICDYVTKPRVEAAITGRTPAGDPIKGAYKFTDEFPMADGLEANARFFTLTYEHPSLVEYGRSFDRIAPMLWMRAGQVGEVICDIDPSIGYALTDFYGVLIDPDKATQFMAEIEMKSSLTHAYVVTDNSAVYQQLAQTIGDEVETVQLYESYLTNFRINSGRDN